MKRYLTISIIYETVLTVIETKCGKGTKLHWEGGHGTEKSVLGGGAPHMLQTVIESKREPNVAKAQNYIGGDTTQKKIYWERGTPHMFCRWAEHFRWGHRTA